MPEAAPGYYQSAAFLLAELERLRDAGVDLSKSEVSLDGCDCSDAWGGVITTYGARAPFERSLELVRRDHDIIEMP